MPELAGSSEETQSVWRYMAFSRFVWLLQYKQLWLSRADMLGDPWEIALAGNQLAHVVSHHPITPLPFTGKPRESALHRSKRIITRWREKTYANCWSASEHESHALWRIYCGPTEGVVIQTTLATLRSSVGGLPVYRVIYETPGAKRRTPTLVDLVTKKRPMFEYENEVRIVATEGDKVVTDANTESQGCRLNWDLQHCVKSVRIHPGADRTFMETVTSVVAHYEPSLRDCVAWSAMRIAPPF